MSAQVKYQFQQLITLFEKTWAERDALRSLSERDMSRDTDWQTAMETSRIQAHELFGPTLLSINEGQTLQDAITKLLGRLETVSRDHVKV